MKKTLLLILFYFLIFSVKGQTNDTLFCRTFGQLMGASSFNSTGYSINATYGEYNGCDISPSLMIAIIDSSSCQPMSTCGNDFGEQNQFELSAGSSCTDPDPLGIVSCGNRIHPWKLFKFRFSNSTEINSMIQLLNNISNGNYILAYTWSTYSYSSLPSFIAFKNAFMNLGSTAIATISDSVPYIFFCKKGVPASVQEVAGITIQDTLTLQVTFQCLSTSINLLEKENSFSLLPNPSNGIFHFRLQEKNSQVVSVKIADITGREIYFRSSEEGEINISDAASGIYFYKVNTANGKIFEGKIVKE